MLIVLVSVQILATARRNRITFGTQMNQHSSRSHALLCITVQGTDLATGSKTTGQPHIHSAGNVFEKLLINTHYKSESNLAFLIESLSVLLKLSAVWP